MWLYHNRSTAAAGSRVSRLRFLVLHGPLLVGKHCTDRVYLFVAISLRFRTISGK